MNDKHTTTEVSLVINGNHVRADPNKHISLLAYLRNGLNLTGSKQGCATGNCGACTVLIDGHAVQSCQAKLKSLEQCKIETIESIVHTALGKEIAKALTQRDAAQCGYCLPGIVVAAHAEMLAKKTPNPVHALRDNLCRCGTHTRILNALQDVMAAAEQEGEKTST